MIQARRRTRPEAAEQPNFWASYSDLMAALLLVFVLLLIVALFHYSESTRIKQEVLAQQETRLKSFHELQRRLIGNLEKEMADEPVLIDPETGVLRIGTGILFGEGESQLRAEGAQRLQRIFEAYIRVVLNDEFRDLVRQIEIEGHTNTNGTYLFNLELSQRRALTVMKELLAQPGVESHVLQQIVMAGGRSYSQPILNAQGVEDSVKSRRIEIHLRLKESELFRDIYQNLSE